MSNFSNMKFLEAVNTAKKACVHEGYDQIIYLSEGDKDDDFTISRLYSNLKLPTCRSVEAIIEMSVNDKVLVHEPCDKRFVELLHLYKVEIPTQNTLSGSRILADTVVKNYAAIERELTEVISNYLKIRLKEEGGYIEQLDFWGDRESTTLKAIELDDNDNIICTFEDEYSNEYQNNFYHLPSPYQIEIYNEIKQH